MFVVDKRFRLLLLHRSNNVRSAKNVWSLPTGLHDIGERIEACAARELHEEFGLDALPGHIKFLGQYENIAGDPDPIAEQYHWVITTLGVLVEDASLFVNKEPDKHDEVKLVKVGELAMPDFFINFEFHPSFSTWAQPNGQGLLTALTTLVLHGH